MIRIAAYNHDTGENVCEVYIAFKSKISDKQQEQGNPFENWKDANAVINHGKNNSENTL